ncbi:MAG: PorV/PorQ family protein [Bacteroidales bacterium]|nr:PorV/PorQ family protein [Bacteroidales bacterium]
MKKVLISFAIAGLVVFSAHNTVKAGNPDRAGQAGAGELLINPWARSSGWAGANTGCVRGLEGMYLNIAGTAFTQKTEILFAHTIWLKGSDININSFGLTQKVGKTGVLGVGVMLMNFGNILITTVDQPEGGLGEFSPTFTNIGISYAKAFSNSIYGGINFRIISEQISDMKGMGLAIDAGIQYVTGPTDNVKFGIALKNVGTRMKYSGDGLTFRGDVPGTSYGMAISQRSQDFELPSLINIGFAYDININETYRLTPAANFTSNSFTKDQYSGGLEFGFSKYFMLRVGYLYEEGITKTDSRTTVFTGPAAGFTLRVPLSGKENAKNKDKGGSFFELDYSYRSTNPFDGSHCIGARINL